VVAPVTWAGLIQRVRRWRLSRQGLQLDRSCTVDRLVSVGTSRVRQGSVTVGRESQLGQGAILHPWGGTISIGRHVFIGPYAVIYGHGGVEIGDHTLLAMHCCVVSSNHEVPEAASIIRNHPDILLPTKIGRDVWLGAGSKVLGGVTIGDGCVIGAGAVVTSDLPAFSIAVGIPARVIGRRA
jgi:serine acetyltransferase